MNVYVVLLSLVAVVLGQGEVYEPNEACDACDLYFDPNSSFMLECAPHLLPRIVSLMESDCRSTDDVTDLKSLLISWGLICDKLKFPFTPPVCIVPCTECEALFDDDSDFMKTCGQKFDSLILTRCQEHCSKIVENATALESFLENIELLCAAKNMPVTRSECPEVNINAIPPVTTTTTTAEPDLCEQSVGMDGTCAVDPLDRTPCGFPGVPDFLCEQALGCCFDPAWLPQRCYEQSSTCSVDFDDRINCHFVQERQRHCEARHCCWDESDIESFFCYRPSCYVPDTECIVDPADRQDCGYDGITEELCQQRTCCYDPLTPDAPPCYFDANTKFDECSVVEPWCRRDCGYPGVSRKSCEDLGCCWDPSLIPYNWCFFKLNVDFSCLPEDPNDPCTGTTLDCGIDTNDRMNCRFFLEDQRDCEARNCCWDDSVRESFFCFRPTCYVPNPECAVDSAARKDCGYDGISEALCLRRQCCYDPHISGVPHCYFDANTELNECSVVEPWCRENCGFPGIQRLACQARGCCWDPTLKPFNFCFFPLQVNDDCRG